MKKTIFILALIVINIPLIAQVEMTELNDPLERTQAVKALAGQGVYIGNVEIDCPEKAFGSFECGNSGFDLHSGIIMSSGQVALLEGPNTNGGATGNIDGISGETDLETLSGKNVHDVCVVRFDLVPYGNTMTFNYIFGSEEYHEYVCSSYNDVFGFFLSGPGINGPYENNAINLAMVPNTEDPVSINTINNGTPWGSSCSSGGVDCPCNPNHIIDNTDGDALEFDGHTHVLQIQVSVVPRMTYSLKFAIADASDDILDSGVFIQSGSLQCSMEGIEAYDGIFDTPVADDKGGNGKKGAFENLTNVDGFASNTLSEPSPNPVQHESTFRFNLPEDANGKLNIYNTEGQLVKSYSLPGAEGSVSISARELENGLYICRLETDETIYGQQRLVVAR